MLRPACDGYDTNARLQAVPMAVGLMGREHALLRVTQSPNNCNDSCLTAMCMQAALMAEGLMGRMYALLRVTQPEQQEVLVLVLWTLGNLATRQSSPEMHGYAVYYWRAIVPWPQLIACLQSDVSIVQVCPT